MLRQPGKRQAGDQAPLLVAISACSLLSAVPHSCFSGGRVQQNQRRRLGSDGLLRQGWWSCCVECTMKISEPIMDSARLENHKLFPYFCKGEGSSSRHNLHIIAIDKRLILISHRGIRRGHVRAVDGSWDTLDTAACQYANNFHPFEVISINHFVVSSRN